MSSFWTTADLHRLGRSDADIRRAVVAGSIEPIRKGHWAARGAKTEVLRAARVGGVATATTAARAMGLWTPPDPRPGAAFVRGARPTGRLQVAVPRSSSRLRDPDDASRSLGSRTDVVVHWTDPALLVGTERTRVAGPLLALSHLFAVQPPERALAGVDSALKARHLRTTDLPALA